ncbi:MULTISPECIES: hypothetical protein [Psychrilyobacter]|uniref:Adhesin domain-containing protein n=1 Tax=Psychrilyobacter piezotolerans TaxID=2293438 RepID=A0ABX9KJY6_9FUSO|nr:MULTISPECIES: hypothetical protein [Psychrilyobacter]MCS5420521.1 hypothetical protein [Psychrilyobacter sp. S5]NDI76905.1 DUF4097 domain-containing protein [Psychrilyobacter piezotolerans]RDE65183.1 hypothetical protein DV867_03015 [Psychrilyobacter sp. S5]REI42753.1 hypothetical protein DYH56_03015 [Psychrilyobacter piezotolerans]
MKNSIFFFFFLILINITAFSNGTIPSKGIKIIEIKGQYIDLTISPYGGENIVLNQLSDKKNPIIKNNITKDSLQYNLNNDKKNSFFKTKVKFDLLIPQNTNFKYLIKTTNSSISVHGINGKLSIDNSRGEVAIDNLVGDLDLLNSNKDITLSNIVGDISVKSWFSRVTTKNTLGTLNIRTTNKKIKIKNAEKIGEISTSNAPISAEFRSITSDSKIVTSNQSLTIKIPKKHNFNFSIFGDLIHVKNEFAKLKTNKFLILGTSNGTINIEKE